MKRIIQKLIIGFGVTLIMLFPTVITFAEVSGSLNAPREDARLNSGTNFPKLENPIKSKTIGELVNAIVDIAFQAGAVVAVVMIVYVGFKFVLAQGNESKVTEAKNMFFWTVVGIAVLFGSKVLAEVIQATVQNLKS